MTAVSRLEPAQDLDVDAGEVLFVGVGVTASSWYRCVLPALFMGADWVGLTGEPPKLAFHTGMVARETQMADFAAYKVVILQQPRGRGWLRLIRQLQAQGTRVLFEIDDYVHAIRKMADHDYTEHFTREDLAALELNMRAADGLIVSTEFLARRYRTFNPHVWVCRNGVDMARYALTRPPRDTVTIGWAGGTGHANAIRPWLHLVATVMSKRPQTRFVSIGMNYADSFANQFGDARAVSIPFTLIDTYPAAMTQLDIALAPAGRGNFFRGKSDLRWIEAGALGIPIIADPDVYPDIEHGVTGFHARSLEQAADLLEQLVDDPSLRLQVGEAAREHVRRRRDMPIAVRQWADVIVEVAELEEARS